MAVPHLDVAAANAGGLDFQKDIVVADFRNRGIPKLNHPVSMTVLHNCQH